MPSNIVVADPESAVGVATAEAAWTTFSSLEAGTLSTEDLAVIREFLPGKHPRAGGRTCELAASSTDEGPWAYVLDQHLVHALSKTTQSDRNQTAAKWIRAVPENRKLTQTAASRILKTLSRQCTTALHGHKSVFLRIAAPAVAGTRELKRLVHTLEVYEDYAKLACLVDHQRYVSRALGAYERGEEPMGPPFETRPHQETDAESRMLHRTVSGHRYYGCERSVPMEAFTDPGASLTHARPEECIIKSYSGLHEKALRLIEQGDWKKLATFQVRGITPESPVCRTPHEDALRGFVLEEESLADAAGAVTTVPDQGRTELPEATITLSLENEEFIRREVAAGRYPNASAMIAVALRHLAVMV